MKHVDWFILDTEGNEDQILQSFPWHAVTVDLIQIEVRQGSFRNKKKAKFLKSFFDTYGFEEQNSLNLDMLFKRKQSALPSFINGKRYGDIWR